MKRLDSDELDLAFDTSVVDAALKGDHEAWDAIVEHFSTDVWSVASRKLTQPEDIRDVCLLTWLRLADHLHEVKAHAIGEWLETTAEREATRAARVLSL